MLKNTNKETTLQKQLHNYGYKKLWLCRCNQWWLVNMMNVFSEEIDAIVAIAAGGVGSDTWPTWNYKFANTGAS